MQHESPQTAAMTKQPFRDSGCLLESLSGLFNQRAWMLLLPSFLLAIALWKLAASVPLSTASILVHVLSISVVIWGCNAAGLVMCDEVRMLPPRPWTRLWSHTLVTSHQLAMVLLTVTLCCLLLLLALAMLLLTCRLPFLGDALYPIVFPVATAVAASVLFILPPMALSVAAPAVWSGLDANACLVQVWSVLRQRLPFVAAWFSVLLGISLLVLTVSLTLLTAGSWLISGMADSLLFTDDPLPPKPPGGATTILSLSSSFFHSDNPSLLVIAAVWFAMPTLVALRGACIFYQHAVSGITAPLEHLTPLSALAPNQLVAVELGQGERALPTGALEPQLEETRSLSPTTPPVDLGSTDQIAEVHSDRPPINQVDIDLGTSVGNDSDLFQPCPRCSDLAKKTDSYCGSCGQFLK